jgi:putative tryptophan/tyrosine transport system substrate-binding protein
VNRRQFVLGAGAMGLALEVGCRNSFARPQAPPTVVRIGYLSPFSTNDVLSMAVREGLEDYGYIAGQNIVIESRFAEGRPERLGELAAQLVGLRIDILIATGEAARPAREATSTIPIVIASGPDPVAEGLAASLNRPGGNVTGSSLLAPQLSAKRLELIKETVEGLALVAVLGDLSRPEVAVQVRETEAAASALGLRLLALEVHAPEEFAGAFATILRERAEALLLLLETLTAVYRQPIMEFVAQTRMPSMGYTKTFAGAGGLMAYGPSHLDLHRRTGYFVDRILKGTKPADLPVEQPMRFDFVINLRTAQALGLTIPQHVLLQATEVLQ